MGYFLQHQIKDINSKLKQLEGQEKLSYLKEQLSFAQSDLKNNLGLSRRLFIFFFTQSGFNNPALFPAHYKAYALYLDEKIKLTFPLYVRYVFKDLIKSLAITRYDRIVNREKQKLVKFIKEKLDIELRSDNLTSIEEQPTTIKQYITGTVDQITVEDLIKENNFVFPANFGPSNLKWRSQYSFAIYNGVYELLMPEINQMISDERILLLNSIKIDIDRIGKDADIKFSDLADIMRIPDSYASNKPELMFIVYNAYNLLTKANSQMIIPMKLIRNLVIKLTSKFSMPVGMIEKDLKILELQRILKKENETKSQLSKTVKGKKQRTPKKQKEREKIVWFGNEVQLIDLFFLLRKDSCLAGYDDESILPHFDIKGEKTTDISKVQKLSTDHFFWFGADNEFAQLIDELAKAKLIGEANKYKLFAEHFQNSRSKPFKNLAQKHYNKKSYNNINTKIPALVKKLLEIL